MKKVMMVVFTKEETYNEFLNENKKRLLPSVKIEKTFWDGVKGVVLVSIEVDESGFDSIMNIGILFNYYYQEGGIEDYVVI